MTKEELIAALTALHGREDADSAHLKADDLLLDYIADQDVTLAFALVKKWYS